MKFFIAFISLLMIAFGGLFVIVGGKDTSNKIKDKVDYRSRALEQQAEIDSFIRKCSIRGFIVFIVGLCLFIASFFL